MDKTGNKIPTMVGNTGNKIPTMVGNMGNTGNNVTSLYILSIY